MAALAEIASRSIRAVFSEYEREVKLSADIANDFRRSWQIFGEITGISMDSPITRVTKATVRSFKQALRELPAGATKVLLRGKSAVEMIEVARATHMKRIADGTLNKHIAALSAVLKFSLKNDYRSDDPTLGIALQSPKKKSRLPYGTDDLKNIFGSTLFQKRPWDERQWLPVLALFTGCRLEELGQLLVSDVKRDNGVWYLAIQEADDEGNTVKSLKTESSMSVSAP
ncbi:site-specific tyrosine recombinase XerD [Magnetospirillum gryphiswaldense MSR-1]|nr:site-specific tyrosine recombinase XerD [Magnetospirillum gryphiswaldense MSR-1]AVM79715.1 site-specific tyrosine recombinase XerD [Magnetospirillum gryphiswaldense]